MSTNLSWMAENSLVKPIIIKGIYSILVYLLFMYDFLIFANGGVKEIEKIMKLFDRYEKASGQVMNKSMTKIFLGGMSLSRKIAITRESGVCLATLPEKYLGIKLITRRVNRAAITNVVDDLLEKLSTYKC